MRGEFVDVAGTRLYYYAAGTRGSGEPIVLLHGFPGSSHGWRLLVPLLPPGRRVVVVDLLGCGRSDGPRATEAGVATHAALIVGLLDDLGIERAVTVGHAFGAAVAQFLAVHHARRVGALALLTPLAFTAWPRRLARAARAAARMAPFLGAPVLASLVHGSALRGYVDREAGRRSLDQALLAYPSRLGRGALVAHLRAMRDPEIAALGERLGEIRAPTAVVCGAGDPFVPAAVGERVRDAVPGATLAVIPTARHFVAEDAPEQCARAIDALLAS